MIIFNKLICKIMGHKYLYCDYDMTEELVCLRCGKVVSYITDVRKKDSIEFMEENYE